MGVRLAPSSLASDTPMASETTEQSGPISIFNSVSYSPLEKAAPVYSVIEVPSISNEIFFSLNFIP